MCTLPSVAHSATSPQCWKNLCCQKLALDLHLQPQSAVCHACRNELSRRTKDPNHKPRWEKDKQVKCAILNCEKQFFSHCGIPLDDIVGCLNKNGESIPTNLKNSVPFCNHHYHLVYNAYWPAQSHCPTCGSALKRGNTRPCPNPHNIERYLSETTGFEGRITNTFNIGFLAFLRLIGTVYYKKYASAFRRPTPQAHFNSFVQSDASVKALHIKWLDDIRNSIYDRTQFENNMIPSIEALYRHWKRACWVIDMWRQAENNEIVLKPLELHGWKTDEDKLAIDWDSEENIEKVQRVRGLQKGCKCKTGCGTNRCGCRHKGVECSQGCECKDCTNLGLPNDTSEEDMCQLIEEEDWEQGGESEDKPRQEPGEKEVNWEQGCPGTTESLEEEVDGIMEWVLVQIIWTPLRTVSTILH